MTDTDTHGRDETADEPITTNRRSLLEAAGATMVGATGVAAASTSASAQTITVIDIEEGGWFSDWSADGSLPVTDELFVFIHGWFGDSTVRSQARDVLDSLESGGYYPSDAVALRWPATNFNYPDAESDTEDVGEVTAGLAEDFYDAGGGSVRLVGHSLGGRCVLWTATKLRSGYEIETVAPLGAAADGSEVCGSPWNDGLGDACEVRNYHSENDSTVGTAYGGWGDTALGNEGAGCDPAPNYTDVDVTDSVSSHLDFLGDPAVGNDLAAAVSSGSCGGA